MRGVIFDLKRFAVHDGPGIRSTLFLKGCPLRCPWCQNPEGLEIERKLWHSPAKCIRCGACVAACPEGALSLAERVHVDRDLCARRGNCVDICPAGALEFDGREVEAAEAAEMLLSDQVFFGEDGGITLSGGEVFAQSAFALEVLGLCKARGVGTAIETCLYTSPEVLKQFLPAVDHFLIDLKYLDADEHRNVLGVDVAPILRNYELLVNSGADVLVRTPLIPGFTATEENIRAIARYVHGVDPNARYELLNFNPLCRSKYSALEREYPVEGGALSPAQMERFRAILREEGIWNIVQE